MFRRFRKPGLQIVFGISGAALTTLALVAACALVLLTTFIRHEAAVVENAANDLHSVETIRLDLLMYGRQSDLALLTHDAAATSLRDQIERQLRARLIATTQRHLPVRQPMVARAWKKIDRFLTTRKNAEAKSDSPVEVIRLSSPTLDDALAAVEQLATFDLRQVQTAQDKAASWDHLADVLGSTIALSLLAMFALLFLGLRRILVRPLISIHDSIRAFAGGDRASRAIAAGPKELHEIADSFNEMAMAIDRNDRERLIFLGGVAHDLRNPLCAMRLNLSMLSTANLDDDKRRQKMQVLERQTTRLERMVGDLVDASQIEAGQLELRLETRDLRQLVEDTVALYSAMSPHHSLQVRLDDELPVSCDPVRIEQVLGNLLSNAMKYSPEGGTIVIDASHEGDEAVVMVKDTGIGISSEDLPHIFDPFRRTGASKGSFPGVGLGLSVAKRLVEAHGGRLEVISTLGAGSTFRLYLSLSPATLEQRVDSHHQPTVH